MKIIVASISLSDAKSSNASSARTLKTGASFQTL
jgi:hypothetical protein